MEAYSRRENLIITDIPEAQDATKNTLEVLQNFMANELNVSDAANIDFQQVHRLGRPNHNKPSQRENFIAGKASARQIFLHVFSDYPEEIQRSWKRQVKKLKDAKQAGKRASFRKSRPDMLYIDGLFSPE